MIAGVGGKILIREFDRVVAIEVNVDEPAGWLAKNDADVVFRESLGLQSKFVQSSAGDFDREAARSTSPLAIVATCDRTSIGRSTRIIPRPVVMSGTGAIS